MLRHVGINLPDLGAAKRYYETLMPLVGLQLFLEAEDQFAYKPADDRPGTYLFFDPTAADGDYSPDRTACTSGSQMPGTHGPELAFW